MNVEDFLRVPDSIVDPGEGMLLLSAPMMLDKYFTRSAVLILEKGEDDTHTGLILNHSIGMEMNEVIENWPMNIEMSVFNGGPVNLSQVFVLHRLGSIISDSKEILPGLFTSGNSDQIMEYLLSGEPTEGLIRFFFGISGWGSGQLSSEILERSWAVNPNPDPRTLISGWGDDFWRREVKALGDDYRSWLSQPMHPSFN